MIHDKCHSTMDAVISVPHTISKLQTRVPWVQGPERPQVTEAALLQVSSACMREAWGWSCLLWKSVHRALHAFVHVCVSLHGLVWVCMSVCAHAFVSAYVFLQPEALCCCSSAAEPPWCTHRPRPLPPAWPVWGCLLAGPRPQTARARVCVCTLPWGTRACCRLCAVPPCS